MRASTDRPELAAPHLNGSLLVVSLRIIGMFPDGWHVRTWPIRRCLSVIGMTRGP
jgi:hypothetical protein